MDNNKLWQRKRSPNKEDKRGIHKISSKGKDTTSHPSCLNAPPFFLQYMHPVCIFIPLFTPERCGWLLTSLGTPWVAQRVWAMPTCVWSSSLNAMSSFAANDIGTNVCACTAVQHLNSHCTCISTESYKLHNDIIHILAVTLCIRWLVMNRPMQSTNYTYSVGIMSYMEAALRMNATPCICSLTENQGIENCNLSFALNKPGIG